MKILIISLMLILSALAGEQNFKDGLKCSEDSAYTSVYIEGCLSYSSANQCKRCQYNYLLQAGLCLYSPKTSINDCCLKFDNNSICTSCKDGLILNPQTKLCDDFKIQGCLQKDQNGCVSCASNYDLVNKICIRAITGCLQYTANGNKCSGCSANYSLSNGVCLLMLPIVSISNCKLINEYGCWQCLSGYKLSPSKNSCLPETIFGCESYNTNGSCLQCKYRNFALYQGQCLVIGCLKYNANNVCQSCDSTKGFALNNNKVCQIDSCLNFNFNGCSLCATGKQLNANGCTNTTPRTNICIVCKNSQYLGVDQLCRIRNPYCLSYQLGQCASCIEKYYLSSQYDCLVKAPGCSYQNGMCSGCLAPFSYSNGQCIIEGCSKYAFSGCTTCLSGFLLTNTSICSLPNCALIQSSRCIQCVDGYIFNQNNICIQIDLNCAVKNSFNLCLQCKAGYQFNSIGRCVLLLLGCNYVDNRCTSCRAPFTYVPATSSCIIDGCITYFLGGCSVCAKTYALKYNSCKLPNCLVSQNGACLQCDPDYIFKSDGTCVNKDEFCDQTDANGTCIKCMYTYYYSYKSNKCVKKLPGCNYDNNDVCTCCNTPFVYQNNRCEIDGCQVLSFTGCTECQFPYILTNKSTCMFPNCAKYENGICLACSQGYTMNMKGLCINEDPNCYLYNDARTECTRCIKGYNIDQNGQCQYVDSHCWDFTSDNCCVNCDSFYFVNRYQQCQIKDMNCLTYVNGYCATCKSYFFVNNGGCMANLKGCQSQQDLSTCKQCEDGYVLNNGKCTVAITQLNWNSIDMDFFASDTQQELDNSRSTFTVGKNNKDDLLPCLAKNVGSIFYTTSIFTNVSYAVNSAGNLGWSVTNGTQIGSYFGVRLPNPQTFYAIDLQFLQGNLLSKISVEYAEDDKNSFKKVGDFDVSGVSVGSIKTLYFTPVFAKSIRFTVLRGIPNIKTEFYYSDNSSFQLQVGNSSSYIESTIDTTLNNDLGGSLSQCTNSSSLCWAGMQACELKNIKGFQLLYSISNTSAIVTGFTLDYSTDNINYVCYENCKQISLVNNGYIFSNPLKAYKMRVKFTKYIGEPQFGIKFNYA